MQARPGLCLIITLREGIELPDGSRVTELTTSVRSQLAANGWLRNQGVSFDEVFLASPPDLDRTNQILAQYRRHPFAIPPLRNHQHGQLEAQQVTSASFYEPVEHHRAMPAQLMLAVLATCLVWGWTGEAAIFAMCWGMLLRAGELMSAKRRDIIFPQDVRFSIEHVSIRIMEPKTRFRAARHQWSKLEPPDLIQVARLGIGKLMP